MRLARPEGCAGRGGQLQKRASGGVAQLLAALAHGEAGNALHNRGPALAFEVGHHYPQPAALAPAQGGGVVGLVRELMGQLQPPLLWRPRCGGGR